jgi:hypothetical protein
MPDSVARRLKRLEQRVGAISPKNRQLFFLKLPRDKYDEAMAILANLPKAEPPAAVSGSRLEASEQAPEPMEPESAPERPSHPEAAKNSEAVPDAFSDKARLQHLRDLSNERDYRNSW